MEDTSRVKKMIERALADGKLSSRESQDIKAAIYADKKVSSEECKLFRLLQEKIWQGEVQIDYY
jgi:hypothetical protein